MGTAVGHGSVDPKVDTGENKKIMPRACVRGRALVLGCVRYVHGKKYARGIMTERL